MRTRFSWHTFDLASSLPAGWRQELSDAAVTAAFGEYPPGPILAREAVCMRSISHGRLNAADLLRSLRWLYEAYHGYFLELAREASAELVMPTRDDRYGVALNVQRGNRGAVRMSRRLKSLTGLLFCTDHLAEADGELVFAHDEDAGSVEAVERDCTVIRPQAGHLIFFDGRKHPHYACPLTSESALRIVAVMNFYTTSCPESTRPLELNRHLYGES
jgi:hypothetical protein